MNQVFEALQYLIRALVDAPQKIAIERIETPKTDIFNISVPPEEMGRLVGRNGRTAEAIRDVLGAVGAMASKEVILDVIEARPAHPPRPVAAKGGQPPRSRRRGRSRPTPQRRRESSHNAH